MSSPRQIYTNRGEKRDFVQNSIEALSEPACDVRIAVAFFTEAEVVQRLIERHCRVELVVRLGFPTSPRALRRVMDLPGVQVRFFTGRSFHPKLYIFGDRAALVGSANLTGAAIRRNQEVVVAVNADDDNNDRFFELSELFDLYWAEATPLTSKHLSIYQAVFDRYDQLDNEVQRLSHTVLDKLGMGETEPLTITMKRPPMERRAAYLDSFQKSYQGWLSAFNVVRKVYERVGYRKVPEDAIPLRLEIDAFLSYVREHMATGNSWSTVPLLFGGDQERAIEAAIAEARRAYWPFFEDHIVPQLYPRLLKTFASAETVHDADDQVLVDSLSALHSFADRNRFFSGGLSGLHAVFLENNSPEAIRKTLAYLVFGPGPVEERMANAIFHPDYKLREFGRANVQELVGLLNNRELPVINGRTTKVLRFFGFDVQQLD